MDCWLLLLLLFAWINAAHFVDTRLRNSNKQEKYLNKHKEKEKKIPSFVYFYLSFRALPSIYIHTFVSSWRQHSLISSHVRWASFIFSALKMCKHKRVLPVCLSLLITTLIMNVMALFTISERERSKKSWEERCIWSFSWIAIIRRHLVFGSHWFLRSLKRTCFDILCIHSFVEIRQQLLRLSQLKASSFHTKIVCVSVWLFDTLLQYAVEEKLV